MLVVRNNSGKNVSIHIITVIFNKSQIRKSVAIIQSFKLWWNSLQIVPGLPYALNTPLGRNHHDWCEVKETPLTQSWQVPNPGILSNQVEMKSFSWHPISQISSLQDPTPHGLFTPALTHIIKWRLDIWAFVTFIQPSAGCFYFYDGSKKRANVETKSYTLNLNGLQNR